MHACAYLMIHWAGTLLGVPWLTAITMYRIDINFFFRMENVFDWIYGVLKGSGACCQEVRVRTDRGGGAEGSDQQNG